MSAGHLYKWTQTDDDDDDDDDDGPNRKDEICKIWHVSDQILYRWSFEC